MDFKWMLSDESFVVDTSTLIITQNEYMSTKRTMVRLNINMGSVKVTKNGM